MAGMVPAAVPGTGLFIFAADDARDRIADCSRGSWATSYDRGLQIVSSSIRPPPWRAKASTSAA